MNTRSTDTPEGMFAVPHLFQGICWVPWTQPRTDGFRRGPINAGCHILLTPGLLSLPPRGPHFRTGWKRCLAVRTLET